MTDETIANQHEIIGESPEINKVRRLIEKAAGHNISVLITGETGTGKELIARGIHTASEREGRLITVNCAAIPENLLESELFGHKKGSFTHAIKDRDGAFAAAHDGTIFLDEIGDMPMALQSKILRVLQEGEVKKVGGDDDLKVNFRVISATNQDLAAAIADGTFREDLYYRLKGLKIHSPTLRARGRAEIRLLLGHFLETSGRTNGNSVSFNDEALEMLLDHPWPGNIREFKSAIESALIRSDNNTIAPEHLELDGPLPAITTSLFNPEKINTSNESLTSRINYLEKNIILKVLEENGWCQAKAAKALGINSRTLYLKIKKHEIDIKAEKNN